MSKERRYPICKLNSRLFSHKVTYNENLAPADETFQSCPLLLLKPVVLVPVITGLASSGGRQKLFALNLPALKVLSLAFPHHFIWDFFTWGQRGDSVWQMSAPCSYSMITLRLQNTETYLCRGSNYLFLFVVSGYSDGIFPRLYHGKLLSDRRSSLCA